MLLIENDYLISLVHVLSAALQGFIIVVPTPPTCILMTISLVFAVLPLFLVQVLVHQQVQGKAEWEETHSQAIINPIENQS